MKKKIILNIIFIFIIYFFMKSIVIFVFLNKYYSGAELLNQVVSSLVMKPYSIQYNTHFYRPARYVDASKPPIVFIGCSYVEGIGSEPALKDEEIITHKFSEKIKNNRMVYNRGMGSQGLQHAIYLFTKGRIFKDIAEEPEYIIYIFINDQLKRLYIGCDILTQTAFYKESKNGGLKLDKNPLSQLFLSRIISQYLYFKYPKSEQEKLQFLKKHFLYMKKAVRKNGKIQNGLFYIIMMFLKKIMI